jgi:hypothetical protein
MSAFTIDGKEPDLVVETETTHICFYDQVPPEKVGGRTDIYRKMIVFMRQDAEKAN